MDFSYHLPKVATWVNYYSEEDREAEKLPDSGFPEKRKTQIPEKQRGRKPKSAELLLAESLQSGDPVEIFHALTRRRPNAVQRQDLYAAVTDPDLWRQTVSHWLKHGWNPANVFGMLDLYRHGGQASCRSCAQAARSLPSDRGSQSSTSEILQEIVDDYLQDQILYAQMNRTLDGDP